MIFFAFVANLLLFYTGQQQKDDIFIRNKNQYYTLEENYKKIPKEKALEELSEKLSTLSAFSLLNNSNDLNKELIEELEKENPKLIDKFSESIYVNNEEALNTDLYLYSLLLDEITYINNYSNYINSMEEKAIDMSSISIFQDENSFSYKNIIKTPKDFEHLKAINLTLSQEKGIVAATNFKVTDIFTLITIFILAIYLFLLERDLGLLKLLKSNKNGRTPIILAKIITLLLATFIISTLFYGSIILLSSKLYGFSDLSNAIQSLSSFRECTLLVTMKEYLIIYLLYKFITLIIVGLFLTLIFLLLKNTLEIYLTTLVLTIGSLLAYILIYPSSYLNLLKYINIFYYLDVFKITSEYININLFTIPINSEKVYFILTILLVMILIPINCYIFCKKEMISRESKIEFFITKLKFKLFKLKGTSSLFLQEFHKIIIYNKSYLIIIALVFITINGSLTSKKSFYSDEVFYKNYIDMVKGPITEKNIDYINKENEKFENLSKEYDKIDQMNISAKEKYSERNKLDLIASRKVIFSKINEQYDYLLALKKEKNIDGEFVDLISYEEIFDNSNSIVTAMVLVIILIILLSNIFPIDFKNNSIKLLAPTKNAFTKAIFYKYLISTLIVLFITLLFIFTRYFEIYRLYGIDNLNGPIQSIFKYKDFPINLSIINFLILKELFMVLGLFALSSFILLISTITKNYSISIIISLCFVVTPLLCNLLSINFLNFISFNNIFLLNDSLITANYLFKNSLYYLVLLILSIFSIYFTIKIYKGNLNFNFKLFGGLKNEVKN